MPILNSASKLIAVDPGITTGMAFHIGSTLQTCVAVSAVEVLEMLDGADLVVVERFQTGGRLSGYGLETIELVGTIKGYCYAKQIECQVVTPQARYVCMAQALSMEGSVITKSAVSKHEVDALAHLLAWETRNRK